MFVTATWFLFIEVTSCVLGCPDYKGVPSPLYINGHRCVKLSSRVTVGSKEGKSIPRRVLL